MLTPEVIGRWPPAPNSCGEFNKNMYATTALLPQANCLMWKIMKNIYVWHNEIFMIRIMFVVNLILRSDQILGMILPENF